MKIKTLVEFEFEVGTLPKDILRVEGAIRDIRDSIEDQIINDGNAYYVDDVATANMTAVQIKEFGI